MITEVDEIGAIWISEEITDEMVALYTEEQNDSVDSTTEEQSE